MYNTHQLATRIYRNYMHANYTAHNYLEYMLASYGLGMRLAYMYTGKIFLHQNQLILFMTTYQWVQDNLHYSEWSVRTP